MTCSCVFGSRCALAMFLRIAPRKAVRHTAMSAPRGVLESFQLEFVTGSRQTPVLAVSFRHEQSAENPGFKPSALAATQSLGGEQIALSSTEPMAMQHVKRDLLHLLVGKLHLFVSFARPLLPQLQFKLALSARPTDMGASVGDGTPAMPSVATWTTGTLGAASCGASSGGAITYHQRWQRHVSIRMAQCDLTCVRLRRSRVQVLSQDLSSSLWRVGTARASWRRQPRRLPLIHASGCAQAALATSACSGRSSCVTSPSACTWTPIFSVVPRCPSWA